MARAADFGRNDRTLFARTHLGHLLHAGDTALGYDLASANVSDSALEKALERGLVLPDVILVRHLADSTPRGSSAGCKRPSSVTCLLYLQSLIDTLLAFAMFCDGDGSCDGERLLSAAGLVLLQV